MEEYKAILHGNFGPVAVNRRLREIHNAVKGLLEASQAVSVITEPVVQPEPIDAPFNLETETDVEALKAYALEVLDIKITGNKKASTIQKIIREKLDGE